MTTATVTVTAIGTKVVTVKGKPKNTYSFKGNDGNWYRTNFKDHELAEGDTVSFPYTEDKWGKNVEVDDIKRESKGAAPAAAPAATGDVQAAIQRQNALRHATALAIARGQTDTAAVIEIARELVSYINGELDMLEAAADAAE